MLFHHSITRLKDSFVVLLLMTLTIPNFLAQQISLPRAYAAGAETITGLVFEDLDRDGIQGVGENGLAGIGIEMYGDGFIRMDDDTIVTGADGTYTITSAHATFTPGASYSISVKTGDLPWTASSVTVGETYATTGPIPEDGSYAVPILGLYHSTTVQGRVFYDANHDGMQTPADRSVFNANVNIFRASDDVLITTTPVMVPSTYFLSINESGDFYMTVTNLPTGYIFSPIDQGENDLNDNDFNPSINRTNTLTFPYGSNHISVDAGVYLGPAHIGDTIFDDTDHDGILDPGESGIGGVDVTLRNLEDNSTVATATTDASGNYAIETDLPNCFGPGGMLDMEVTSSYDCAVANSGGGHVLSFTTGMLCSAFNAMITLTGADGTILYQEGCGTSGTLIDMTQYDLSPFIELGDGTAHLSFTSDMPDNGIFLNIHWSYGNFRLEASSLPTNYIFSPQDQGADDTVDSDFDASGYSDQTVFFAADTNNDFDAGAYEAPSGADLSLNKSVNDSTPSAGDSIIYHLTVTNSGPATATGILVTDLLPSGVTYDSHTGSGSYNETLGQWNISSIASGDTAHLYITATVDLDSSGSIVNTAEITSASTTDPDSTFNDHVDQEDYKTATITVTAAGGDSGSGSVSGITGGAAIGSGIYFDAHGVSLYAPALPGTTVADGGLRTAILLSPRKPCLVIGGGPTVTFNDIATNSDLAFLTSITFLSDHSNLIRGYGNNTFGPGRSLTRFELLKVALGSNCLGGNTGGGSSAHPNTVFSDVPHDNSEVSLVVGEAYARGIVKGIDGKFFPDAPVSNAEMLKMLLGSSTYFFDGNPVAPLPVTIKGIKDPTFVQYIEKAHQLGLISQPANQDFPQDQTVDRMHMAATLAKFIRAIQGNVVVR